MTGSEVQALGGWALVECIGRGGMGEVWRAERPGPGGVRRQAAVKRILRKYQSDTGLGQRFIAEARTTARLDHPNVVRLLDFGDAPELYLVLEYVDGASLHDWLKLAAGGEASLPIEAVLFAVAEASAGLDFAHRCVDERGQPLGIVHRDVSPANVLLSAEGAVKVNDFGVARAADNVFRTEAGLAVGKLAYMAPEQARGEPVDRRADVFSLGVCLWELLALRPMLPRTSPADTLLALMQCKFDPPSRFNAAVSPELDALVLKCLEAEKTGRPGTADALARSLRTLLARARPGYTTSDFAATFRQSIPRLAERQRFEPPSAAGALEPRPAQRSTLAEVPSAKAALPAPAPAAALVTATPAVGLTRPEPVAARVAPAAALPSVQGGAPLEVRPPSPLVVTARLPASAAVANAAPARPSSSSGALVAVILGAVVVFALSVAGVATLLLRTRDDSVVPEVSMPPPPSFAYATMAAPPQVSTFAQMPAEATAQMPAQMPTQMPAEVTADLGGVPNEIAASIMLARMAQSCATQAAAPDPHGTLRVIPPSPSRRGSVLRIIANGGRSPTDRVVAECVERGVLALGAQIEIPAQAFNQGY